MITLATIHNRTPYGSVAGTILCLFALLLDFYFSLKIVATNQRFESDVLHGRADDSIEGDLYIIELVLAATTFITAVAVPVSGVVGSGEKETLTRRILGGKIAYLVLLVCTLCLLIGWIFLNLCRAVLLGVYVINVNNCDAIKSDNGCIVIAFDWGTKEKTFCGKELEKCCDDYVDMIYLLYFGTVASNQMILVSLVIYICCLAINFKMSQLQEKIECSELDYRRY